MMKLKWVKKVVIGIMFFIGIIAFTVTVLLVINVDFSNDPIIENL